MHSNRALNNRICTMRFKNLINIKNASIFQMIPIYLVLRYVCQHNLISLFSIFSFTSKIADGDDSRTPRIRLSEKKSKLNINGKRAINLPF